MTTRRGAAGSSSSRNASTTPSLLSSAVSSLVRAQYGLSSREDKGESSTDLDKHVAELLLKEAQDREAKAKAHNTNAWSFSDDEDGNGKQFTSKTNKRFLKSMLKGVEEHNAPLRRKEESPGATQKESLDSIRKREREAREKRTGVKDASRSHVGSGSTAAISSTAPLSNAEASGSASEGGRKAPGFAARALAMGLSGAVATRETRQKDLKSAERAVEDAKSRAASSHRSDNHRNGSSDAKKARDKGKSREIEDNSEYYERRRKREDSRERVDDEDDEYYAHSRRPRSSTTPNENGTTRNDDLKGGRRHRSRDNVDDRSVRDDGGMSDGIDNDCVYSPRHHRRRSHSPDPLRQRRCSSRQREDEVEDNRNPQGYRKHASSRDIERPYDNDHRKSKHSSSIHDHSLTRKRSRSHRSLSMLSDSVSEHPSDDSSDTFVDYTGAADAGGPTAGNSKMDKYFSPTYDPALDVSFKDLEDPQTGLIAEGNYAGWDQMLSVLKKRKEDKITGVSREREEERERQLRKLEKRKRREERETRRALRKEKKRKRNRRHSSDDEYSDSGSSVGPKERRAGSVVRKSREPDKVVIDGFEYGGKGSTRAWDLGKKAT